jgi:hypothetical protein
MAKKYNAKETVRAVASVLNPIEMLYQQNLINWKGIAKDDNRPYSEIISEELLRKNIIRKIKSIKPINRQDYRVASHNGRITYTNRKEENLCKKMWIYCDKTGKNLNLLGKAFDYQVPLKSIQADYAGKIDLVSYDKKSNRIYLIEVKKQDNKETLLRSVFEIATYYQLLNKKNFLRSYEELKNFNTNDIKKTVLIYKESSQYHEFQNLKNNPNLNKIIDELDIEIFSIKSLTEKGDVIKKIEIV